MKSLRPNEVSYIIEAQIRGISVDEVLGKTPPTVSVVVPEPVVKKVPAKKRTTKSKEPKVTPEIKE